MNVNVLRAQAMVTSQDMPSKPTQRESNLSLCCLAKRPAGGSMFEPMLAQASKQIKALERASTGAPWMASFENNSNGPRRTQLKPALPRAHESGLGMLVSITHKPRGALLKTASQQGVPSSSWPLEPPSPKRQRPPNAARTGLAGRFPGLLAAAVGIPPARKISARWPCQSHVGL